MRCERIARDLLDAWVDGDALRLSALLGGTGDGAAWRPGGADEQERSELLEGIKAGLSAPATATDAPSLAVSVRLLRHLAAARN